ncbi:MAG: hypothetical protein ACO1RA_02370 [Planctomycetaceae bacterium]
MKITSKYTTICTMVFQGSVSSKNYNPAAHGGVQFIQVRRGANGILARRINSTGRHDEIGEAFVPTAQQLANWEAIAKAER